VNWIREVAEQNMRQTKATLESLASVTRRAVDGLTHHGAVIQQHSLFLAEKALSNTLEYGDRIVRVGDPQELVRIQTEFMSKQAELFAEHAKKMEQSVSQATDEIASIQKQGRSRGKEAA
jgi:hypothetical protein